MNNPLNIDFRTLAGWMIVSGCLLPGLRAAAAEESPEPENWPAWRRDGSGIAAESHLPVSWSERQNVLWHTALPGEGNSSPIVWGRRIFLTSALDDGATRLVLCLDADGGRILWKTKFSPITRGVFYTKTGFAAPTAVTDGQQVYAFFGEPGLVALDMRGNVVWTHRLGPFRGPYNVGSSPVLYRDLVIQCCDDHGPSFLVALGRDHGEERWRVERKSSSCGHFGTPLLIWVQGRPQLVVNAPTVVAYDPDTGHELWSCQGMKECVGPSAAFGHGLVYASSGRTGPVMAIDPTGHGDVTETHVRLHLTSGGPYVPTPLVYPHLLVPGDNGKMLFYNSAGKLVLEDRIRDHFTSSPVGGDGKIYWCSERGKTYVIDAAALASGQPSLRMLAVNQLGGTCLATPAIAGGRLFIRTDAALYCIAGTGTAAVVRSAKAPSATFAELQERYERHRADWKIESEARIRLETLEAIAELDDPQVIPFLLHTAIKEPHWDICEEAAKSLGAKGQPAIDSLIELLPDRRPFIRTVAVNELGRLKAVKAVPQLLLVAAHDKEALLRSVALQALGKIGGQQTPCPPEIVAAMLAVLANGDREEAVVRQSALDGLAALKGRVAAERKEVVQTLAAVVHDRNPRLAHSASDMLKTIYHLTPAEMEKIRQAAGGVE